MLVQRKLANERTLSNTQILCDYYLIKSFLTDRLCVISLNK